MKALVVALIAGLALAIIPAANAARDPRLPALQRQVSALSQQVNTLTQRVQRDEMNNRCDWTFQQSINIGFFNIFAAIFGASPYSGATPNDGGACAAVGRAAPTPLRFLASKSQLGLNATLAGLAH